MLIQLYKNAYSGLSRDSWYLCLVMLINRSGTMVLPFMTIYCTQQLHFSITQAGIIMGLFGLGSVTGAFLGGKITDKVGFYDLQIFALLSGGMFFIILGLQHSFISIAAGSFILSMCNDAFRPANSTAIAHYSSPESRTRSFSLNRLAVNLGWAFGGALGGFLASINYHLLFWVDGCTNIMAAIMLLILIPRIKIKSHAKADAPVATKAASPYRDGVYLLFIGLVVLYGTCFFQLFTMQPVFYKTEWHFNERFIGVLMALNGIIITVVEMVLIHNLEGKRHPLKYISIGVLLVGAGFVVLNVCAGGKLAGLLVIVLITFGEMMSMPFMNSFWIVRTSENNRGAYAALYTMAWSVAQTFAPPLGSQIIMYKGFATLWWVLGALCAITSLGFVFLYKFNYSQKAKGPILAES